jgi:hypothetical protein
MKWTKTKPTVPVFYWFQSPGGRKRVEIHKDPSTRKLYVTHTGAVLEELSEEGSSPSAD